MVLKNVRNTSLHPLTTARSDKGLSLGDLSRRMQIERKTISRWERGETIPKPSSAKTLAHVLDFESGEQVRQICRAWQKQQATAHVAQPAMDAKELHPIEAARTRQDLGLRDLARKMRLSPTTIERWESGQHIPTSLYAQALASALGFESGEQVRQTCIAWRRNQGAQSSHPSQISKEQKNEALQ